MTWKEFRALLAGLPPDSPLARTVQIRLENDPKVLENFTSAQHRIRDKWRSRKAQEYTETDMAIILAQFEAAFASM